MKPWNKLTPYPKGERVIHNGVVYEATANTMAIPGESTSWREAGKHLGELKQDVRDSADNHNLNTPYEVGSTTRYKNAIYKAVKNTLGTKPDESDAWQDIRQLPVEPEEISLEAPEHDLNNVYAPDDITKANGRLFKAIKGNYGSDISDRTNWQQISKEAEEENETPIQEAIEKTIDASVIIIHQHGYDGKDGDDGDQGLIGPQGTQGLQGEQGPKGDRGTKGDKGDTGPAGPRGLTGERGEKGPAGDVRDRFIIGGSGYRNKIMTHGSGTSLIFAENKHSTAIKSIAAGTNVTVTDNGLGTLTIASSGGSASSPLTTKGDIWGFSSIDARIPIGTDTYVLTADSGQALGLKWAPPPSGSGVTLETDGAANTDQTLLNLISGTNITLVADGSGGVTINSSGGGGSIPQSNFNIIG